MSSLAIRDRRLPFLGVGRPGRHSVRPGLVAALYAPVGDWRSTLAISGAALIIKKQKKWFWPE